MTTSVKPEVDAAVHSPQIYNGITATLNCTLCGMFVTIVWNMRVLHKM